jgi:hypothetical protein
MMMRRDGRQRRIAYTKSPQRLGRSNYLRIFEFGRAEMFSIRSELAASFGSKVSIPSPSFGACLQADAWSGRLKYRCPSEQPCWGNRL